MSKISKKKAKDKIDELLEIEEFKEEKLSNKKVRLIYEGTKKDKNMADNGFSKKQLEQLSQLMDMKINPINNRLYKIESRLDVLEKDMKEVKKDIKDMKATPTMSKELKKLSK